MSGAEAVQEYIDSLNKLFDDAGVFTRYSTDAGKTWQRWPLEKRIAMAIRVTLDEEDAKRADEAEAECESLRAKIQAAERDAEKYRALATPEIQDFLAAVEREALHQRDRWGANHDAGKTDDDWFWLIGYLAGKARSVGGGENLLRYRHLKRGGTYEVLSVGEDENQRGRNLVIYRGEDDGKVWCRPTEQFFDGRFEELPPKASAKLLHHVITTAAACLNWHSARVGAHTSMRPGTDQAAIDAQLPKEAG